LNPKPKIRNLKWCAPSLSSRPAGDDHHSCFESAAGGLGFVPATVD
jgi:hypothetical protein